MNFARCCFVMCLVVLVSCSKPKEGATCTAPDGIFGHGPGTCIDKQNALVCVDGTFKKLKCGKSATGCMEVVGNVSCDVVKDVGEPCPESKADDAATTPSTSSPATERQAVSRYFATVVAANGSSSWRLQNARNG